MNEGYIMIAAAVASFLLLLWVERKGRKYPPSDDGSDDGGGGGSWDKPKGTPPSGPDRDIDKQFHALADAVGKSIKIEEKPKEKVLT